MRKVQTQKGIMMPAIIITIAVLGAGAIATYAVMQLQQEEKPQVENENDALAQSLLAALQREGKVGIDATIFIQKKKGKHVRASMVVGGVRSFSVFAIHVSDSWNIVQVAEKAGEFECERLARTGFTPDMLTGCFVKHPKAKTVKQATKEKTEKTQKTKVIGFVTKKTDSTIEITSEGETVEISLPEDVVIPIDPLTETLRAPEVGDMLVVTGTLGFTPRTGVESDTVTAFIETDSYEGVSGNDDPVVQDAQEEAQEDGETYAPQSFPEESFEEDEDEVSTNSGGTTNTSSNSNNTSSGSNSESSGGTSSGSSNTNTSQDVNTNNNSDEEGETEVLIEEEDEILEVFDDPLEGAFEGDDDEIPAENPGEEILSEAEQELLELLEQTEESEGGDSNDQDIDTLIKRLND